MVEKEYKEKLGSSVDANMIYNSIIVSYNYDFEPNIYLNEDSNHVHLI